MRSNINQPEFRKSEGYFGNEGNDVEKRAPSTREGHQIPIDAEEIEENDIEKRTPGWGRRRRRWIRRRRRRRQPARRRRPPPPPPCDERCKTRKKLKGFLNTLSQAYCGFVSVLQTNQDFFLYRSNAT